MSGLLRSSLVAVAVCACAPASAQAPSAAGQLLSSVRDLDELACELVGRALSDSWGGRTWAVVPVSGDAAAVREVLDWVGTTPIPDAEPLEAALLQETGCARRISAQLLGRSAAPRHLAMLRNALGSDDPGLAQAGAAGLGHARARARDSETVRALVAALGSSAAAPVRRAAAWALGRIEARDAVPALIGSLRDADPEVRVAAAWALGQLD